LLRRPGLSEPLFVLRKVLVLSLFNPLFLIVILGLLGSLKRKSAFLFVLFLSLYAISITPVADRFIAPLEKECKVVAVDKGIRDVVVLSGGAYHRKDPISSSGCSSLKRLLCGIELCKGKKDCRIYISGGSVFGKESEAELLFDVAKDFTSANIIVEGSSRFTEENAEKISGIIGKKPFYLVTSAWHMKRALMLFREKGLSPVAYCCDYLKENSYVFLDYFPHYRNVKKTFLALHEYAALLYYRLRLLLKEKVKAHYNGGKSNKK